MECKIIKEHRQKDGGVIFDVICDDEFIQLAVQQLFTKAVTEYLESDEVSKILSQKKTSK